MKKRVGMARQAWSHGLFATGILLAANGSATAGPLPVPQRGFISSQPARTWEEGLLSGNGTIGINVLSRPLNERIIFTHERLFMPMGAPRMPPDQSARLFEIRKLIDCGLSINAARKVVIWIGALLAMAVFPAANTESTGLFILLVCVGLFGIQFKSSNMFALPADMFAAKEVATIWGIFGAAGSLGGALFQTQVGILIDTFSYHPVFAAVACMHIFSALAVMFFIPKVEQLGSRTNKRSTTKQS